jgi:hypothetical protein
MKNVKDIIKDEKSPKKTKGVIKDITKRQMIRDNQNNQKGLNVPNNNNSLAIFKDNKFNYLYQKSDRIVTAIYLVTNFMSPEEPLKWQIRKSLLQMLDSIMELGNASMSDMDSIIRDISTKLFQIITLFDVAYRSGFISHMNYEIISAELANLASLVSEYDEENNLSKSQIIKMEHFSVTQELIKDGRNNTVETSLKDIYKGHNTKRQDNVFYKNNTTVKTNQNKRQSGVLMNNSNATKQKKTRVNTNRRDQIISIIKQKGEVSVKDISDVIKDTSEKTLQRELIAMVSDNVLKKTGERRWSRYSMNKTQ